MTSVRRADRVARLIQDELSRLVLREVRDPRVESVTFTRVALSPDLREAVVYFVPMGGVGSAERVAELESGLKAAGPFLQGKVGRNLRLRNTPRLRFRYDKGVQNLVDVHDLLRGLNPGESRAVEEDSDGS